MILAGIAEVLDCTVLLTFDEAHLTLTDSIKSLGVELQLLHWLSISFSVQFKVLTIIYKALHGLGSKCIKKCLS